MCVRVRIAQAAVMWNVVYNPIERVIAPVIRGNPWGWDPATTGDDWPCVPSDWNPVWCSLAVAVAVAVTVTLTLTLTLTTFLTLTLPLATGDDWPCVPFDRHMRLQPCVAEAATLCGGGCNSNTQAATLYVR